MQRAPLKNNRYVAAINSLHESLTMIRDIANKHCVEMHISFRTDNNTTWNGLISSVRMSVRPDNSKMAKHHVRIMGTSSNSV